MMLSTRTGLFIAALVLTVVIAVSPAAMAAPFAHASIAESHTSALIKIHGRWHRDDDDDGDEDHDHDRWHRHHHPEIVDAPFTHVEAGRRVIVEAPLTSVYSGRHGHHIVAPFVDLWIPR